MCFAQAEQLRIFTLDNEIITFAAEQHVEGKHLLGDKGIKSFP